MIIEYRGKRPKVAASAFVAPSAVLIGDVEVGPESSIWFGAVLRGDNGPIRVGARTSIQDNAVVHVSEGGGTFVGDDVTVGHCAVMEDCRIEQHALIGSNATLLNGCTVGEGALIAAGSVVGPAVGDSGAGRRGRRTRDRQKAARRRGRLVDRDLIGRIRRSSRASIWPRVLGRVTRGMNRRPDQDRVERVNL